MELTKEELMIAKGHGFLPLKDGVHFSCRVIIPAGHITKEQSNKISEICDKYGKSYYTLTQRLDIEIPFIKYEDIESVKNELKSIGLENGGTGKRVRPIHTCKGTVCKFGLIDTEKITNEMHKRFYKGYYDTVLPNKIRLGVGGCKNSCPKAQLSCIGVIGKKLNQVIITIGGTFGTSKIIGKELKGVYTPEEALDIVERGIIFYKNNGIDGERFFKMVDRLGFDTVQDAMLNK
ncbi:hypothetical protein [Faecalimicrobium sp. JNUCC 81]